MKLKKIVYLYPQKLKKYNPYLEILITDMTKALRKKKLRD
jgi:hypothetical protein